MLLAHPADDLYRFAAPVGLGVGLLVGLYYYWKGRGRHRDAGPVDPPPGAAADAERDRCPHCRATLPEARDAFCPACREPLNE